MKIPFDKQLHFVVCFVLALTFSAVAANLFYSFAPEEPGVRTLWAYSAGVALAMLVSIAKELYDRRQPGNHFCWLDLLADFAGAALGALCAFVSYLI